MLHTPSQKQLTPMPEGQDFTHHAAHVTLLPYRFCCQCPCCCCWGCCC
jgi:hypothetical protein